MVALMVLKSLFWYQVFLRNKSIFYFLFLKKNCTVEGIIKLIFSIVSYVTRIYVQYSPSDLILNRVALSFGLIPRSIYFDPGSGRIFSYRSFKCRSYMFFSYFFVVFSLCLNINMTSSRIVAEVLTEDLHKQEQRLNQGYNASRSKW